MSNRYAASRKRMANDLRNAQLLQGQRLAELLHDQYYFNEEKCLSDVGPLLWRCDEHQKVAMYLLSDGESVGADESYLELPTPFALDAASVCSWRRENLLRNRSALFLEGKIITAVQGVVDEEEGGEVWLVGFQVAFETGDYLIYLNQGDDAVVLINEWPKRLEGFETCLVTSLE
ncbi:hypothetical protein [Pseudomonas pharyngis]|uniref:hypothetical protein n=1 Tax=Pseudomonas pharyngis TaxID=2892333 RepID=UPI001F2ECF87|nr:hypothetical protein [Pseudomonas pharyngis]